MAQEHTKWIRETPPFATMFVKHVIPFVKLVATMVVTNVKLVKLVLSFWELLVSLTVQMAGIMIMSTEFVNHVILAVVSALVLHLAHHVLMEDI